MFIQSICSDNLHDGTRAILKTIGAQIVQKLKNNEPRPKFTGSYKKERVPQGTVLAPLLFSLFIDDIETNIHSQMRLFSDDCLVHRVIKKYSDCLQLQEDISSLCHGKIHGR